MVKVKKTITMKLVGLLLCLTVDVSAMEQERLGKRKRENDNSSVLGELSGPLAKKSRTEGAGVVSLDDSRMSVFSDVPTGRSVTEDCRLYVRERTEGNVFQKILKQELRGKRFPPASIKITLKNGEAISINDLWQILEENPMVTTLIGNNCRFDDAVEAGMPIRNFWLPLLQELDLSYTYATPKQVAALVARCPALKKLNVQRNSRVATFVDLLPAEMMLPLEELNLKGTYATPEQVAALVARCPALKNMSSEVAGFVDFLPVGMMLPLEELDLEGSYVTHEQVAALVARCPTLKRLNVQWVFRAGGFINFLPAGMMLPLEELDLNGTYATPGQVALLVARCPALKKLYVGDNYGVAGFINFLPAGMMLPLEELGLKGTYATPHQLAAIRQRCLGLKRLPL